MRNSFIGYALAMAGAASVSAGSIYGCASVGELESVPSLSLEAGPAVDAGADEGVKAGSAAPADFGALGAPRTVFVNAIKGGPDAIRLCFTRFPNTLPIPNNQFAPLSNRLGIPKGTAVAIKTVAGAAQASYEQPFTDLGTGFADSQEVALIEAAFADLQAYSLAPCAKILKDIARAQLYQKPRFVQLTKAQFDSAAGLQTIAFTGNWDEKDGITAQVLQSDIGYRVGKSEGVSFQFSNLANLPASTKSIALKLQGKAASFNTTVGALSNSTVLLNTAELTDDTLINWSGPPAGVPAAFRLVEAQRYLDPSIAPKTYFRPRSNVVMLLVGDASERPKPVSEQLHFIAVPATDPEQPLPVPNGEANDTANSPATVAPVPIGDAGPDAR